MEHRHLFPKRVFIKTYFPKLRGTFFSTGDGEEDLFVSYSYRPEDQICLSKEVPNVLSEWRVYFFKKEIVKIAHYKGDPTLFPSPLLISAVKKRAQGVRLVAHAVDLAVSSTGEFVMKSNDMTSCEDYGLPARLYALMIASRRFQILDDGGNQR